MDFSEPQHKKVIGIIYIVFSALGLLGVLFYDFFMTGILEFASNENPEINNVTSFFNVIGSFIWALAILFLVPRMIVGFGLANGRKWANIPGLVFGVISLINFPLGTLLGIYAILVFTAKPKDEV